jgi:hypothetical protein
MNKFPPIAKALTMALLVSVFAACEPGDGDGPSDPTFVSYSLSVNGATVSYRNSETGYYTPITNNSYDGTFVETFDGLLGASDIIAGVFEEPLCEIRGGELYINIGEPASEVMTPVTELGVPGEWFYDKAAKIFVVSDFMMNKGAMWHGLYMETSQGVVAFVYCDKHLLVEGIMQGQLAWDFDLRQGWNALLVTEEQDGTDVVTNVDLAAGYKWVLTRIY